MDFLLGVDYLEIMTLNTGYAMDEGKRCIIWQDWFFQATLSG
jgi:hypothetical protein